MTTLDRGDHAPALYLQLVTHFRDQIASGALAPGSQLPTEIELTEQFGVSRNTIRQAMNTLVHEGLLERTQGRGTFVRAAGLAAARTVDSAQYGAEPDGMANRLVPDSRPEPRADRRIGLVLSHVGDQLNMELLLGVEQAAKSRGYEVSFSFSEENGAVQERDVARLQAGGVCGFIIFPLSDQHEDHAIAWLREQGTPLVLIDRYLPSVPTDYVGVDNYNGGYRAAEHLCILGHKRIGLAHLRVGGMATTSVHDRWRGYRQALQDYGVAYDEALILQGPDYVQLAGPNRPTAVFAINDDSAFEVLKVSRALGLRVPEDLALVGFDDLSHAVLTTPPLTTVAQPRIEVGMRAGHLLIDRMEGQTGAIKHIELPAHLVVRDSCGAKLRVRELTRE